MVDTKQKDGSKRSSFSAPVSSAAAPERARVRTPPNARRQVLWTLVAAALAGLSTYYSNIHRQITALPDSYALCGGHGKIYTVDDAKPAVDCLLVRKDVVIATGSLDEVKTHWNDYQNEQIKMFYGNEPSAKKPLKVFRPPLGSIVVPGLADAHAHIIDYGFQVELPLDGASSLDEVLNRIEAYISASPELLANPDRWVEGMGWDQTRWTAWRGGFPTAADLASRPLLAARPLALRRVDGHALWVSPRVVMLARDADVSGGEVVRGEDGKPTGVYLDAAMALVPVPAWTEEKMKEYALRTMTDALSVGLTSVHDAAAGLNEINIFSRLAEEGQLPIRVYAMGHSEADDYWGDKIPRMEKHGLDGRLTVRSVKLFTDGALGSWGAALLEPYTDKPDTRGIMRTEEGPLRETIERFWADGWGVNIHCIGDRANKIVLDILEGLLSNDSEAAARRRPRIEHAQIMRLEDVQRAGRLGVITSVQPTHATSDMWYAESRLGPERIKGAYAYQSLLRASANNALPLGSDFPVEGINPLLGFYAAVARLDVNGESPHGAGGWYSSERLTRAQALKGMTLHAAYAAFSEDELGSLVAGKKADYVILDRDIMNEDAPFADILKAKVRATVIDGHIAYGGI